MAHSLGFYGDGISFWVVFSQSFWLRVLPGGARLVQPRWMPVRRILWGGWTCGVSFWPFPNSSGWWWLILCYLPGLPVIKQLMQIVTMVPGQGERFQPVCFPWQYSFYKVLAVFPHVVQYILVVLLFLLEYSCFPSGFCGGGSEVFIHLGHCPSCYSGSYHPFTQSPFTMSPETPSSPIWHIFNIPFE